MEQDNLKIILYIREYLWLIIPLIGALIGWVTNYLAVKMLFRPKNPVNLGLFSIQGVFPKRQTVLAEKVGELVATELLSKDQLAAQLGAAVKKIDLKSEIIKQIDIILLEKIPQKIPMAAMIINNDLANMIKGIVAAEMEPKMNQSIGRISNQLTESFQIKELVTERIAGFSSDKLERLIVDVMRKEFKFIEIFGAILGFGIGVVQVLLMSL